MATWDPTRYLAYADERGRPFVDLLARVPGSPRTVADLGCGPGNLTAVIRARWPGVDVVGVDSSPEMIARAVRDRAPDDPTDYVEADLATWRPATPVDLVVSNAALQWVPDHRALLPRLASHVAPGGSLAFQLPGNHDEASHVLLAEIGSREPYASHLHGIERLEVHEPSDYLADLADLGWTVDAWETTYLHVLPGDDPVLTWISGTGARPTLQALPDDLRDDFVTEYAAALREAYPRRPWGTVLPFRRIFAVAQHPAAATVGESR